MSTMQKSNLNPTLQQAQAALKKYWYVPGLLILVAVLFGAGSWYGKTVAGQNAAGGRRILHYVDPMNPAHTSAEPGLAPCGMKMEPVYADDGGQAAGAAVPAGSVKITPEKQQIIGVRVATVEKSPWTYTLRTVGKVAAEETRIYRLNAFIEGWVVRMYNTTTTGSLVRKDEPLATFYNRDLPTTLQTYYYALDAVERMNRDPQLLASQHDLLLAQKLSAEGVLMNLGMGKPQLDDLARSRKLTQEIIVSAPATSFVLARNITPGQRFGAGEELFRLADLSRVWVLADLFENEAKYVRPGEKVSVKLPKQDEKRLATVSEIQPEFDPATVTLKVRLEMDNPGFTLRPGMFVDVEFPINKPPTVNVPVDAIMDSGLKQTIFVDRGNGYFEPRRVETGWRLGDRAQIVEGLKPGERIVVSGNFLIDSESRMKLAAAGFFGNVVQDPVCGHAVDETQAKAAGLTSDYAGKTYYFCSYRCNKQFDKDPAHYVHQEGQADRTAANTRAAAKTVKDPVCGLEVAPAAAKQAGRISEYQGKTYYFDTDGCKQRFDRDPQHYLSGSSNAMRLEIQPYPQVPLESDMQRRYKGTLMRMAPQGPTPARPPGAPPAPPAGPTAPMAHPGGAPGVPMAMPHAGAQVTPPAGPPSAPQAATPVAPQESPVKPAAPQTPPVQPAAPQTPPPAPQAPPP